MSPDKDPVHRAAQDLIRDVEQRLSLTDLTRTATNDPVVSVSLHEVTKLKSLLNAEEGRSS